jgi:L-rhamnose mutarotase
LYFAGQGSDNLVPKIKLPERAQTTWYPAVEDNFMEGEYAMKRYGMVLRVKPEKLGEYKRYHARVWPEVLDMIRKCNIRNYSIYHKDGWLFSYFEYHGNDLQADMDRMAAHPKTQEWWAIMKPMQLPLETRKQGEWWAEMEEVFHTD